MNRIELSSPVWKTGALAVVLHLRKKSEKNIQTIIKFLHKKPILY